ncbi:transglutaminase family protein [Pseudomonas lijiangensis]|uniref:Transglutaminase family protein n=1 Tax=Pseudomonas lijiangensis TaxID=2995658 RepID=A0ABX8HTS9_9PSED|nr:MULTISPECIES: transglutaminase family protein [Pseudomonas syringae group]MBX8500919.1 transglutaminase family protein [Pseudomonas lijiangensis]MBX8505772.1 transglutaminase family protein [Pseudomonas lijiangensis]MBX8549668.1 transglutaminase family protein [Pseudomonas cichorii]MBX8555073.1 transglutaminase family protein [Pseudomonas cichorii]MBX8560607.1 transglutaminase family protein [Pseudomonas cichorii]
MSAHYQILHDTHYKYDSPVSLAQQLAHLWPRSSPWQRCSEQHLEILPTPTTRRDELDVFGNPLTRLAFERPHDELQVNARLRVEVLKRPELDFNLSPDWEVTRSALTYSAQRMSADLLEACRYRFESPYVHLKRSFAEFSQDCFPPGRPLLLCVQALMEKIFEEFTFDGEATQVATPLVEVLERRRGVCQDFAHLMLACLRSRGLAARYVSGYLLTQPPPGQPRLIGADASHAWVSVFCPASGWVDFDPTNNIQPALEHISLAWGRDFSDVSPLRGVILGGGNHDPEVRVTVMPIGEMYSGVAINS